MRGFWIRISDTFTELALEVPTSLNMKARAEANFLLDGKYCTLSGCHDKG
jgi:hypothetical protein